MSEEQAGDLNFNELIGNLLTSHNNDSEEKTQEDDGKDSNTNTNRQEEHGNDSGSHLENPSIEDHDVELPDFDADDVGEDDFASVVANAMQGMNTEISKDISDNTTSNNNNEDIDEHQQSEWAQILQQGMMQADTSHAATENDNNNDSNFNGNGNELDQDDENLRMAILESLQGLGSATISTVDKNIDSKQQEEQQRSQTTEPLEEHKKSSKKSSSKKKKKDKTKQKGTDKSDKSLKKKKHRKDKEKDKSAKEKSSKSKDRDKHKDDEDHLVQIDDVIRGIMQEGAETGQLDSENLQDNDQNDAETQALVEATLKAFEKELMASDVPKKAPRKRTSPPKTKKTTTSSAAPTTASKSNRTIVLNLPSDKNLDYDIPASTFYPKPKKLAPVTTKTTAATTQKKKKKKKAVQPVTQPHDEDYTFQNYDFSKVLADMVNQVVQTSLTDETEQEPNGKESDKGKRKTSTNDDQQTNIIPSTHTETIPSSTNEEPFDLNQIMQNAMTLAFRDNEVTPASSTPITQTVPKMKPVKKTTNNIQINNNKTIPSNNLKNNNRFENIIIDDFSKELSNFRQAGSLSSGTLINRKILSSRKLKLDKNMGKELTVHNMDKGKGFLKLKTITANEAPKVAKKSYRHKYSNIAIEAAAVARKRSREKTRALKLKLKEEKDKVREEKKRQQQLNKEKLENEQKELEEIVNRGPPYPSNLRLTKKGVPKKPYRRWTAEEMAIRARMQEEEILKPSKIKKAKKPKKEKEQKPKKIPLSILRTIPLFNYMKDNSSIDTNTISDIESTLNRLNLPELQIKQLLSDDGTLGYSQDEILNELKSRSLETFNPFKKTVIHREKIAYHPPWMMPLHPPYALPVARRKRTDKKDSGVSRKQKKMENDSSFMNATKRLIPVILNPIINTLKAAARRKIANGASPEEASRQLLTIISHTKKAITQVVINARQKRLKQPLSHIKIENKRETRLAPENKSPSLQKIPILNMNSLKQIQLKNEENNALDKIKKEPNEINHIKPITMENPASIVENTKEIIDLESEENSSLVSVDLAKNVAESNTTNSDISTSELNSGRKISDQIDLELDSDISSTTKEITKPTLPIPPVNRTTNVEVSNKFSAEKHHISDQREDIDTIPLEGKIPSPIKPFIMKEFTEITSSSSRSAVEMSEDATTKKIHEEANDDYRINSDDFTTVKEVVRIKDEDEAPLSNIPLAHIPLSKISLSSTSVKKEVRKPAIKKENSAKVESIVQSLVKEHLKTEYDNGVLPTNLSNMITSSISSLIPKIQDEFFVEEEKKKKKEPRFNKNKVLNLDGLIPPASRIPIFDDQRKQSASTTPTPLLKKAFSPNESRTKAESSRTPYKFEIPDLSEFPGKKTLVMKKAKNLLNDNEKILLKKEINKERKRKWREANVLRNWENDSRSRLRKRANVKFGDANSAEKRQWIEISFQERCKECNVNYDELQEKDPDSKKEKTSFTDEELLNIIATNIDRLDVARTIEREISELVKELKELKPAKRRKLNNGKKSETPIPMIEIPERLEDNENHNQGEKANANGNSMKIDENIDVNLIDI